ncbi:MAG: hypothetical protein MJ059_06880 [Lachnospiraceae bacterium]|nr:hypothetical protein [Lachnospiraceae bacterium]
MTTVKRIENILIGLLMIFAAVAIIIRPDEGYAFVVGILGLSLLVIGIKTLVYYFAMAIHMVGGKMILYEGIILTDLGLFSSSLATLPKAYVMIYLVLYNLIEGGINVMSAMESKKQGAPWKKKMGEGLLNIAFAILCIAMGGSVNIMVEVYAAGMIISAISRIAKAFRKTAIVYIQ